MAKRVWIAVTVLLCLCLYPANDISAKTSGKQQYTNKYVIGVQEKVVLDYGKLNPKKYVWTSSDPQVAIPTKSGKVIGNKKGNAIIKCYGKKAKLVRKYKISVKAAPKKIAVKTEKIAEFPNCTIELSPVINKGAVCNKFICKSSDKRVADIDAKGTVKTKAAGNAVITVSTYNGVSKKVNVRVKDPKKAVAFTFDDGPAGNNTTKVLDVLEKYDYHATFFITANRIGSVRGSNQVLQRMVKNGNEIGTHTWQHNSLPRMSKSAMHTDIKRSMTAIYNACGQYPTVMRPPGGAVNSSVLEVCKELKLPVVIWNNDTNDWRSQNKNSAKIKSIILNSASAGEVVLLHDLHQTSVDGFVSAVPELKKRGYELVTVSELAELHGDKLQPGKKFFGY